MNRQFIDPNYLTELSNGTIKTRDYYKLHKAVTSLGLHFTGEMESARDIASDCLVSCWRKVEEKQQLISTAELTRMVQMACEKHDLTNHRRIIAESGFLENQPTVFIGYNKSINPYHDKLLVLTSQLEPYLQQIIEWILLENRSLHEISTIIGKPYAAVKNSRDLAIHLLKRMVNSGKHF